MSPTLVKERQSSLIGEVISSGLSGEVLALCPMCKAFQTVWFADGRLQNTRKFSQFGHEVYHDCNFEKPCRLYRSI